VNINKILKNKFVKNVIILFTGTSIAQFITIVSIPILSRIYSPDDYGFYGFYLSILSILTIASTGRYEMALFLSNRNKKNANIFVTIIIITTIFALLTFLFIFFIGFFSSYKISYWLYILSFSTFLGGAFQTLVIVAIRNEKFKNISINNIYRAIIVNILCVIFGIAGFGVDGLMVPLIIGQVFQTLHLYWGLRKYITLDAYNFRIFKAVIYSYRNFLKFSTISAIFNSISLQLPFIFLKKYFSINQIGYYFQSYKLLSIPSSLLARSIGNVFAQEISQKINSNELIDEFVKSIYRKMIYLSFLPFSLILVFGDILISIILGSAWNESGIYAQIISPWLYINFIIAPLTYLFELLQKQKIFAFYNFTLLLIRTFALIIGFFMNSVVISIALFSLASAILYIAMLIYLLRLSGVKSIGVHLEYLLFFAISSILLYMIRYGILN